MYSVLDPRKNEINSDIFFNLFNIDYLMILDSEKKSIDISKYEIISEIQKEDEEKIILLRFKNYKSNIILNNDKKIIDNNKCKTVEIISCLLKDPYLFQA